jgi:hypothetical protein
MMSRVRLAVVALTAVGLGAAGIVDALDCEGRLVTMGMGPWDMQTICGDPRTSKPQRAYIDLEWSLGADRGYNRRQAAYRRGTAA